MAIFQYRARAQNGRLLEAEMDAASQAIVVARLQELGAVPIRIAQVLESSDPLERFLSRWRQEKVKLEDLIVFSRQMYRLTRAGIPIVRAIIGLAESTRHPTLARVLRDVADSLRSGRELSASLQLHADVFPEIVVNVVRVGEDTGRLEDAFDSISSYLELEVQTRKRKP